MKWWKRRKKKDKRIEDMMEQIQLESGMGEASEQKETQTEHDMLERCEELIEMMRELEEAKSEYRVVTDYLKDIQIIKEIPQEDMEELQEIAGNGAKLNQARDN